ncbi:hypothetical protein ACWGRF_00110 [Streptomyces zhihengii]
MHIMSQAWSVYVELGVRDLADSMIEELCERLADCEPAVGTAPNGNLSARVWIETATARQAIDSALKEVTAAARAVGIPTLVVGVELVTEQELDRRNDEPIVPDLAGISEIAEMFGVGRQRAAQLAKRDDFPPAVAQLKAGPVFLSDQVKGFESRWDRHGGRPIKRVPLNAPERRLLEYLLMASHRSQSGPVHGELPERGTREPAEITVSHHGDNLRAVYASDARTVSDSIRTLKREQLVSVQETHETPGEQTVVDLGLTLKGERVAAM